jgi:flagellar biosynthesis/type III secretory pathway chaperone
LRDNGRGGPQRELIRERLRRMLLRQQGNYTRYLNLMEKERSSIAASDMEKLLCQIESEKGIIAEIQALNRVILPLERLYGEVCSAVEDEIRTLLASLVEMGERLREENTRNRRDLEAKMEELGRRIAGLRAPPRPRPAYGEIIPRLIDTEA